MKGLEETSLVGHQPDIINKNPSGNTALDSWTFPISTEVLFECANQVPYPVNCTEVQNPRCKLDDKCVCLPYVFGSVLACAIKSAHVFQELSYSLRGLCLPLSSLITLLQTVRFFYVSVRFQAPQQQYTVLSFSSMQWHSHAQSQTDFFTCTTVLYCGHTFLRCIDLLALFPGPRPASRRLQYGMTGSWAGAWERGYRPIALHCMHYGIRSTLWAYFF